jgi:hypothetical protein
MSENRTVSIMLFVLGLFLIAVGIGLATVSQTIIANRYYFGVLIPYQDTIHPYQSEGVIMVLFGIIVLVIAFIVVKARSKKTIEMKMETPKTEQIY